MVVGGQPRFGETVGLRLGQHAERHAGFHVERADALHHGQHAVEGGAVLHFAPGRAHAEARRARILGDARLRQHVVHVEQRFAREPGLLGVMRRLRAVFAVLGAGTGLDRQQARQLDLALGMEAAMHRASLVNQVEQRRGEQGEDFVQAPVVANPGSRLALARGLRPPRLAVDRIHPFQDFRHVLRPRLLPVEPFANTG